MPYQAMLQLAARWAHLPSEQLQPPDGAILEMAALFEGGRRAWPWGFMHIGGGEHGGGGGDGGVPGAPPAPLTVRTSSDGSKAGGGGQAQAQAQAQARAQQKGQAQQQGQHPQALLQRQQVPRVAGAAASSAAGTSDQCAGASDAGVDVDAPRPSPRASQAAGSAAGSSLAGQGRGAAAEPTAAAAVAARNGAAQLHAASVGGVAAAGAGGGASPLPDQRQVSVGPGGPEQLPPWMRVTATLSSSSEAWLTAGSANDGQASGGGRRPAFKQQLPQLPGSPAVAAAGPVPAGQLQALGNGTGGRQAQPPGSRGTNVSGDADAAALPPASGQGAPAAGTIEDAAGGLLVPQQPQNGASWRLHTPVREQHEIKPFVGPQVGRRGCGMRGGWGCHWVGAAAGAGG
jgi:hypothetical protein